MGTSERRAPLGLADGEMTVTCFAGLGVVGIGAIGAGEAWADGRGREGDASRDVGLLDDGNPAEIPAEWDEDPEDKGIDVACCTKSAAGGRADESGYFDLISLRRTLMSAFLHS